MKKTLVLTLFLAVLAGCGSDDKQTPCEAACDKANALACPADDPDVCVPGCTVGYTFFAGCEPQFDALISCFAAGSVQSIRGLPGPE